MAILSDEERERVAAFAIRDANLRRVIAKHDWKVKVRRPDPRTGKPRYYDAADGDVEIEIAPLTRKPLLMFIAELIVDRDEYKRQLEKLTADSEGGESDDE